MNSNEPAFRTERVPDAAVVCCLDAVQGYVSALCDLLRVAQNAFALDSSAGSPTGNDGNPGGVCPVLARRSVNSDPPTQSPHK